MSAGRIRPASGILSLVLAFASSAAFAESIDESELTVEHLATASAGGCFSTRPADFEQAGYMLAEDASVRRPAPWFGGFHNLIADVRPELPKKGELFSEEKTLAAYESLKDGFDRLALGNDASFRVKVLTAQIKNCNPEAKTLDLVYTFFVFSSTPLQFLMTESRNQEIDDSGGADVDGPSAARWKGGLRTATSTNRTTGFLNWNPSGDAGALDVVSIEGGASRTSTLAAATVGGTGEDVSWLGAKSAHWLVRYDFSRDPADSNRLVRSRGLGQFLATTSQIGRSHLVLRYGTSFEGGSHRSEVVPVGVESAVADSNYTAWKLVGGASAGSMHHDFKASYGFQLGWTPDAEGVSYRKQVADVSYRARVPAGSHRLVEIEADLALGRLEVPRVAPVGERFFGGVGASNFLVGSDWTIRAAPQIRSIPYNRLSRLTPDLPVGGEDYVSFNFTAAWPAWRLPILPPSVAEDGEFQKSLNAAKLSARSQVESYHFNRAQKANEATREAAERLHSALMALSGIRNLSDDCPFTSALRRVSRTIENGDFLELGPDGDVLGDFFSSCSQKIASLGNSAALQAFAEVRAASEQVVVAAGSVDKDAIERATDKDFQMAARALDFFVNQMNMISVSPVFVFDVARIGPNRPGGFGGLRYGVGGGIRIGLVSHANLTIGYAVNPDRRPSESRGAWFASLEFLDLIR